MSKYTFRHCSKSYTALQFHYVYILQQQYQSALFWADKVASLSHGECPVASAITSLIH